MDLLSKEGVYTRVEKVIFELGLCAQEEIRPDANLHGDLGLDSLDGVELMLSIEKEFGIEFDDEVAEKIVTVNDIVVGVHAELVNLKRAL